MQQVFDKLTEQGKTELEGGIYEGREYRVEGGLRLFVPHSITLHTVHVSKEIKQETIRSNINKIERKMDDMRD